MGTILEQLPGGARVAVICPCSLGDCVLTTPALEVVMVARFRAGFAPYRYSTVYNVRIPTARQILTFLVAHALARAASTLVSRPTPCVEKSLEAARASVCATKKTWRERLRVAA